MFTSLWNGVSKAANNMTLFNSNAGENKSV
jgi:hypothetical protein